MTSPLTPDQAAAVERGKATGRHIAEARLVSEFDRLFDLGGVAACLHIISILTERLLERIRRTVLSGVVSDHAGWLG